MENVTIKDTVRVLCRKFKISNNAANVAYRLAFNVPQNKNGIEWLEQHDVSELYEAVAFIRSKDGQHRFAVEAQNRNVEEKEIAAKLETKLPITLAEKQEIENWWNAEGQTEERMENTGQYKYYSEARRRELEADF